MPKIIEKLAYSYSELSDKVKQKLKDRHCEHVVEMDFEVECSETILEELGFSNPKIAYSWINGLDYNEKYRKYTCSNIFRLMYFDDDGNSLIEPFSAYVKIAR